MFDWIKDLISGVGDSIGNSISSAWETVSNSIWGKFMEWLYTAVYNGLSNFFTMMTDVGAGLFDLQWVQSALKFFSYFGWGMFVTGLVVAIFDIAIEYQTMGKLNVKRQILPFLWGLLAVNLFTVVPVELFKFCVSLQNTFAQDLIVGVVGQHMSMENAAHKAMLVFNRNYGISVGLVLGLAMIICFAYCVIKCFFSNIKRGGILLTQIAVGSLHMFGLPRGYSDGFIAWCKQIIAICFTTFMQNTLLLLGLITIPDQPLIGLGVMLAANEVPRIAEHYGLETGTKPPVMGAIHATTSAVNIARTIAKK